LLVTAGAVLAGRAGYAPSMAAANESVVRGVAANETAAKEADAPADYKATIQAWRKDRETRLRADDGWLTVAGLFWLKEGANRFGTDASNDIVLPPGSAPGRAGVFDLRAGKTSVTVEGGAG